MTPSIQWLPALLLLFATASAAGQTKATTAPPHLADYDAELRRADGHVDSEAMVRRLKELGITKYFIVMTAGSADEFRLRHGDPASPERIADWLRMSLQAWRDGQCDGVVTYCLDKRPESRVFPLAQKLFGEFRTK